MAPPFVPQSGRQSDATPTGAAHDQQSALSDVLTERIDIQDDEAVFQDAK